ncbi:4-hydroxythreonine-4-phosphate dehydrogenase PdxA [Hydrogenophaga sp. 5NK40-0174]|uniref:4-hydroxythreonine-4-phosphate dehydrogenase PdxA n=1 Tax=Hydrogenophaga sp. 5NK40-0174 TaxID=3127649 RepID=UPI0033423DA7
MALSNSPRPVAISMGDPAGIGPEIVVRAMLERPEIRSSCVVYGHDGVFDRACGVLGVRFADLFEADDHEGRCVPSTTGRVQLVSLRQSGAASLPVWGQVSAAAGHMAAQAIKAAAAACLHGHARALVTAPIHKEALAAAGEPFPGHTEMLQHLAALHAGIGIESVPVRMMLSCPGLRTVLMSIHVSLQEALAAITAENLRQTILLTQAHFSRQGVPGLRVAVAGVNPHAGEGGLFGRQELDVLGPVVASLQAEGVNVSGPHAPDTVFMRARQGEFDLVIAMYHDQGLIPVKLMGLEHGVNTTIGLPFLRTSPDHGTAFDLAGTGSASCESLLAALEQAMGQC